MKKPYYDTMQLYSMMVTPGENKLIREYIEDLERRIAQLEEIAEQREFVLSEGVALIQAQHQRIMELEARLAEIKADHPSIIRVLWRRMRSE